MPTTTNSSILDRVRTWPDERRQEAEQLLADMEQAGTEVYRLSEQERKLVEEALDEANRGEFVSEAEMEAFWRRHDT